MKMHTLQRTASVLFLARLHGNKAIYITSIHVSSRKRINYNLTPAVTINAKIIMNMI